MSMQMDQPLLPPPQPVYVPNSGHSGHGSVGVAIAVSVVVLIIGVIAGVIGRLCTRRRVIANREIDVEGWLERKCSSCIDGYPAPPPPAPIPQPINESVPVAIPVFVGQPKETPPPDVPQIPPATTGS